MTEARGQKPEPKVKLIEEVITEGDVEVVYDPTLLDLVVDGFGPGGLRDGTIRLCFYTDKATPDKEMKMQRVYVARFVMTLSSFANIAEAFSKIRNQLIEGGFIHHKESSSEGKSNE